MTSTLFIRKTPKPKKEPWAFKLPVKQYIARRFYDHDGSCGGGRVTVGPEELSWFEGILEAASLDPKDRRDLEAVINVLREGETIDMWFEN